MMVSLHSPLELTSDREALYNSPFKITHNATRSGYRLKGPVLQWARDDGGEGGSHPANVIDEPYPYGGLNWNGDDPVILPLVRPAYHPAADFRTDQ
jgi:urea carboxylase